MPTVSKYKKLVLIDGNAIIHRAYHALPPLTTKKGELVNAVYGFASVLLKVISELKPEYILATFDLAGPTFRHVEYADYKATRVKAPDDLYAQIERVKEMTRAMGIPIYEKQGFEADDVIGTLVSQAEQNNNLESLVVTGDLDTLQLVSPRTKVYALRRGMSDTVIYDEKEVENRYTLRPDQMIDYKGLRGDPSDNIPGVKGIGEKTAIELLKNYETLEGVYKNLDKIKGAVKEKLERDKMQAFMSKKLATISRDVPVSLKLEEALTHDFDREKLVNLFSELNFFSLIKRIPETTNYESNINIRADKEVHPVKYPAKAGYAKGVFNGVKDFKFEIVKEKELGDFIKELSKQKEFALNLKTIGGKKYFENNIMGAAFSWKNGRAFYLPWNEKIAKKLKPILEDEKIEKIGFDLKFCWEVLKGQKINLEGMSFDVLLAQYVLNTGSKIELSNLILEELGEEFEEEAKNSGQLGLHIESEEETARKVCQKADYIWKLRQILEEKIGKISATQGENTSIKNIFQNVEMPLVEILAKMEVEGVRLNKIIFAGISETLNKKIENLEKGIHKLAGMDFNINSPKQLAEVLFEKMKIPTTDIKKGKTGFSTASSELQKIRKESKIVEKIEEYRELFKLKTTYLDTLPELADKKSRIHTTFNQAVTATGRLSSSDPNLQNIPIRTELGQLLRTAFEAEKGYRLVSGDYSQIDLRVVAHVSGDKKMIETFAGGVDIHRATAAEINKVALSQVTDKMRRAAKALNFGVIYGMSVFGFSESAEVSREDAKKFIDEYMGKFQGVAKYMRKIKMSAKENGYVETQMGRRRYLPEINSPNFQVANAAERMAINMPIQGLAADIVKLAMIKIQEEYENNPDVKMLLQIHDEIILEVKEPASTRRDSSTRGGNIADEVAKKIKEIMESAYQLKVPLVVDVKVGDNWGEI
jgi:DNA polymerase I